MSRLPSRPMRLNPMTCGPPCRTAVRRHSLFNQSLDLKVECLVHWEHDALHLYYLLIFSLFFFFLNLAGKVHVDFWAGGVHDQAACHFSGGVRRCRHYLLYALLCVISGYLQTVNQFMVWIVEMSSSLNLQTQALL